MRVRYTLRALGDLDTIFSYLEQRDTAAAQAVKDLIGSRIEGLAEFPLMAPATDAPGVHELSIVRYPYKVYYELEANAVWVLHVRDERRAPWKGVGEWRSDARRQVM